MENTIEVIDRRDGQKIVIWEDRFNEEFHQKIDEKTTKPEPKPAKGGKKHAPAKRGV